MKSRLIRIERHSLGPRVHLLGRRVHEYHVGLAALVGPPAASVYISPQLSTAKIITAIVGLLLVVKDWPDLFPATRDKASWQIGLHKLPPGEARAVTTSCCARLRGWSRAAYEAGSRPRTTLRRITSATW